jgi:hypothetical protein
MLANQVLNLLSHTPVHFVLVILEMGGGSRELFAQVGLEV